MLVTDTTADLVRAASIDPVGSVAMMRGLRDVLQATAAAAHDEQQFASATQWTAGIAQGSLGAQQVEVDGERRTITKLDSIGWDELYGKVNGVLRLRVMVSEDASSIEAAQVKVTSADIRGVSQELADHLYDRPLRDVPLPIEIELAPGRYNVAGATITRDEAGGVRVVGRLPYGDRSDGPNEELHAASTILDRLLTRSLEKQGVQVASNDATGRGDR